MKKNQLFVVVSVVVALIAIGILFLSKPTTQTTSAPATSSAANSAERFVRDHSPRFGPAMARVTVTEWLDPECESCRMLHPKVKEIMNQYKDQIHFVYRFMPYHSGSMYAASALLEAQEMGKYEEALDILFEKQPEWGDHHSPNAGLIPGYLTKIGIPAEKLQRNYLLQKHEAKVKMDEADGEAVGVTGTPTFFVNGRIVQFGEEHLRAAIENAMTSN